MAKILFTSFYRDKSDIRQLELELCIKMNISNPDIDKIFVFLEGIRSNFELLEDKKVVIIESPRPTYKVFFDFVNKVVSDEDISIIANTDIFFDETINLLDTIPMHNTCVALSRWHYNVDGSITLHHEKFSQDTWIFKGKIRQVGFSSFHLGERGCDNRISYELNKAGYRMLNPAKSIRTIHYHLSDLHNYGNNFVPKPYLPIEISELK